MSTNIHEKNCYKSIETNDYTSYLLNFNLFEFHKPNHQKINFFKAFKILVLIKNKNIEEVNCFLLTLNFKEWKSKEIQIAYNIFNATETWSLNELINISKKCEFIEFKNIINEIIKDIERNLSNIKIEEEEDKKIEETLKEINKLIELKKKTEII